MSQNDFNVGNQSFPSFRADLNSALQALASNSSGATAPSTTYAYQTWYDTSTDTLNMRNEANDGWIELASFDQTSGRWLIVKDTGVNGSAIIPSGSTAQRDSTPSAGYLRQNSSTGFMEFYNGSSWVPLTGTTDTQTLTNKTLTSPVLDGAVTGDAIASQAEAEAGTATDQLMTPLRTAQAIAAMAGGGGWEELDAGTGTWGGIAATPMYDFAVDGSLTAVFTPNFEDGYEYHLIAQDLNGGSTFIDLFFETSANLRNGENLGAGRKDFKSEIKSPRIDNFGHRVHTVSVLSDGTVLEVSEVYTSNDTSPVRQKVGYARVRVLGGTTSGVIRLYRRPMPGSAV